MSVYKRGTLLITSGPAHDPDRKHLHVVCSEKDERDEVLIVGICSVIHNRHDQTCVLKDFEHDFLKHDSYVFYAECRYAKVTVLESHIAQNSIIVMEEMNQNAFLKVRNGVCRSPDTPRKIKNRFGCAIEDGGAGDNDNDNAKAA